MLEPKLANCDNCEYEEICRELPPCIRDAYEQGKADERTKLIKEIHTNYNILEPSKFREYLGQLWWNLEH